MVLAYLVLAFVHLNLIDITLKLLIIDKKVIQINFDHVIYNA